MISPVFAVCQRTLVGASIGFSVSPRPYSFHSEERPKVLVEAGLVACANVLHKVRSIFRWEGKVTEEQESLIVLKTRSGLMKQLEKAIKKMHSYSVPEIIAIPIVQGSNEYLNWIRDVTSK